MAPLKEPHFQIVARAGAVEALKRRNSHRPGNR